jgi:hypothetical protein
MIDAMTKTGLMLYLLGALSSGIAVLTTTMGYRSAMASDASQLASTAIETAKIITPLTQIPIHLIAWTALGTFLGASASTLVATKEINSLAFYRRVIASMMGGLGLTPMLITISDLLIRVRAESRFQVLILSALNHPAVTLGLSFIISILFWTVTSWYQERNNRLLDKLSGLGGGREPTSNHTKTLIVVAESVKDAEGLVRSLEQPNASGHRGGETE